MKPVYLLAFAAILPFAALAQGAEGEIRPEPAAFVPMEAEGVTLAEFQWIKRLVVVFADSPNDPAFAAQMRLLAADPGQLAERDVVVIADTDPEAANPIRQRLRPRGFSLVLVDKDGEAKLRKPLPWDVREITRAIDKFPLRRQEVLEQFPSGR